MNETNPHRLPNTLRPTAYRLLLEPDLSTLTFRGEVTIDVSLTAPTREIALHAAELEILQASVAGTPATVRLDSEHERVWLAPNKPLDPGRAELTLHFSGTLNDKMRGFYQSTYTRPDGTKGVLATTQFEATSARRCFPCFDEPAFKATFDVTLVVPHDRTALSNMPIATEEQINPTKRRVRFSRTPAMSTYLLAFAVGEFDALAGTTPSGVPVHVYTTPGRSGLGRFALETAQRGLEFFDQYYGIPYRKALPKLDLLAVPDFEAGAMENWGLITFRETAIFVDPEKSSVPQRRRVAEVVLHELAHQWFGNLVSPEWWSYLWLNESFATFMAFKAVDALFPEWKIWEECIAQITSAGFSLDSLRSSHAVEVPVHDPNEVDQIFDAISYNKGGSVLRMLEQAMGEETFRDGIRRYLHQHAYGNATTDDLWTALGEKKGLNIRSMMDGWTRRTGFPVVIARREPNGLSLRQERFLLDRNPDAPEADPTIWEIPLSSIDATGRRTSCVLSKREGAFTTTSVWTKLNAGQAGFYHVHYDEAGWAALAKAVGEMVLDPLDRYGLQEDAYALMRAGYLAVPTYLKLVEAYSREENHHVWSGLAQGLRALTEIFVGDPYVPRLEEWAQRLYRPITAKVGWNERTDEPHDRLLLRATVLGAAVHFGDPATVREVKQRFDAAKRAVASVPPNLQSLVFAGAARHGDEGTLDALITLYENVDLPEVKVRLLGAMGAFREEKPIRRAVAYALSNKVRAQDAFYVSSSVPIEARATSWALLKEHWAVLDERYGKSGMIGRFITAAGSGIPTEAHARDVEAFFRDHPAPYATEKIRQMLEGIRARARFRERNRSALEQFFR